MKTSNFLLIAANKPLLLLLSPFCPLRFLALNSGCPFYQYFILCRFFLFLLSLFHALPILFDFEFELFFLLEISRTMKERLLLSVFSIPHNFRRSSFSINFIFLSNLASVAHRETPIRRLIFQKILADLLVTL